MVRLLVCAIVSTLFCGAFAGCGKQAPKAAPKAKPPAPAVAPVPLPPPPPPPPTKSVYEEDPAITLIPRLGLSAEQAKKANDLVAEYAKKSKALSENASDTERRAVTDERNAKVREGLSAEQQPKFDAGLKIIADHCAKVTTLQQTNFREMMAVPKDQMDKRRQVRDDYKAKRAVLDAEVDKALDEAVGKKP